MVLENEKADETQIVREYFHSRFAWFSRFFTNASITTNTQRKNAFDFW